MSKSNRHIFTLFICMSIAVWLCFSQISGREILILSSCAAFLMITSFSAAKGFSMAVLFFFLPWSTLLKLNPSGKSFYTIALVVVCMILFVKQKLSFNGFCLAATLLIFVLSIGSKLLDGSELSLAYLMFLFMLVLFPNMAAEKTSFKELVIFFSMGILTAALSAKGFYDAANIAAYITIHDGEGILRYSGYYGDANFYSAHISAAISGLLLIILKEERFRRCLMCGAMILGLFYCGTLAASKTFFLTTTLVFLLWLILIGRYKSLTIQLPLLILTVAAGIWILSSGWLETIFIRLQRISSISGLTTGRTELWLDYLKALMEEPKLFLLGIGLTESKLHGLSAHNTILQIFYQLGCLGVLPLVAWMVSCLRVALPDKWLQVFPQTLMLGVGCFLPWLALDLLFFDEFFLLPLYWAAGCQYALKGGCESEANQSAGSDEDSMETTDGYSVGDADRSVFVHDTSKLML